MKVSFTARCNTLYNPATLKFRGNQDKADFEKGLGWPKHSLAKRAWQKRYIIALLLPVLASCIALSGPGASTANQGPGTPLQSTSISIGLKQPSLPMDQVLALLMSLFLMDMLNFLIGLRDSEKLTSHELGHFLAALGSNYPFGVKQIKVSPMDGHVELDLQPSELAQLKHQDPALYEVVLHKHQIIAKGGRAMERLTSGYNLSPLVSMGDPMNELITFVQQVQLAFQNRDIQPLISAMRDWWSGNQEAEAVLKRFTPETVSELTKLLQREKFWDQTRIGEIIEQFHLDTPE